MQRWNVGFVIREWVKGISAVHSETATINRVCVRERLWATQVDIEGGDASQRAVRQHGAWVVVSEHSEVGHSDAWVGFRFRVVVREDGVIRNKHRMFGIKLGDFVCDEPTINRGMTGLECQAARVDFGKDGGVSRRVCYPVDLRHEDGRCHGALVACVWRHRDERIIISR